MNKPHASRLPAPQHAHVVSIWSVAGNTTPPHDARTGHPVPPQKNKKRSRLLAGLAGVAMLLLLAFSGKAQTYSFALSGPNVSPPNASPGTGTVTVTINTVANTMRVVLSFTGLIAPSTSYHIHAATASPNTGNCGIATPAALAGMPISITSGSGDQTYDMTLASSYSPAFLTNNGGTPASAFSALQSALAQNKAYFDIHTTSFPGGEIRAFPLTAPTLNLSADSTNVPELTPAKTVVYTVTASAAVATDQKVKISFTGTASASDYIISGLVNDSLTIPANATSATFTLTPVDDAIFEGNETVIATMSGPTAGFVLGTTTAHTLTIRANDTPTDFIFTSGCATFLPGPANFTYLLTSAEGNYQYIYSAGPVFFTIFADPITNSWVVRNSTVSYSYIMGPIKPGDPTPPCSGTLSQYPVGAQTACVGAAFNLNGGCYIPIFPATITKQDATCSAASDGWAKATPGGTCGTGYQYLWTPGNFTTDSIGGLAPGTYNVRVVCGTDTVNKSVVIGEYLAPPSTRNQSLCSGSVVADLVATPASGNSIAWYSAATGGTPLTSSTALVNGTKYYAAQVTASGCESSTRAADSVVIRGVLNPRSDTAFCSTSTFANIPMNGSAGNTYNWTATQNGTGIAASGTTTSSIFFTTGSNAGNSIKTDTVTVAANYTFPLSYGIKDSTYYFADTTGSVYLNGNTLFPAVNPDFPLAYYPGGQYGDLTDSIAIGFTFNFYGINRNKIFIGRAGRLQFNRTSFNLPTFPGAVIEGYNATWVYDALSKVAYTTKGSAPNRQFIVTYLNLKVPPTDGTNPVTANPVSGRGIFQIVLHETTNTIEVLHQLIPSATTTSGPVGFIKEAVYDVDNGGGVFVPGRAGGSASPWLRIDNENKIFFPVPATTCATQRDTFLISVLPAPKVDSIANQQVCPGSATAAVNFSTPITGITVGYKWTNSNPSIGLAASGFGNIPSFTTAATSQTSTITVIPYIIKTATDTCFGAARTFTIAANFPPAPTTTGNLVVYTGSKTIGELAVTPLTGGTINFYYAATGGSALAGTTPVVDDTTYHITQTVNGCESAPRKAIKVNRIANDTIALCTPATVAGLTATPQPGNTAKWYNAATGGTALAGTTTIPAGQNTFYVEEGNTGAPVTILTYTPPAGNAIASLNSLTIAENDSVYHGVFNDSAKLFRADPSGSNPVLLSKGLPGESIRYMQYETEGGNKYILYTTQNFVKRRNIATGAVSTVWTSPTSGSQNLRQVSRDVANNKLYVADAENGRIKLVDLATNTAVTIDSLAKIQFGASFFTARPFGVCYSAPNTLYFSDFERNRVYRKNIATGVRTDSITISQPQNIQLLPDGRLLIVGAFNISTVNADLTGQATLVTGTSGAFFAAQFNSNNELVFVDNRTIKKLASVQSNRVPVTVIVNPTPNVTATADKVVCHNGTVAAISFSSTTTGGTVTYAWTNNKPGIGLAAGGTGNISSFTAVNNGTAPDTARVIVTPTITNAGVSCTGVKDTFLIIVNPLATVNPVADRVLCNGANFTAIAPTSPTTGGTVTYAWTNDNPAIGLAAGGSGNVPAFTTVNNGTAPVTATVIITPTFTNGGVSCTGVPDTFFLIVNPTARINAISDQTLCNGGSFAAVTPTTTAIGGTVTYAWTNNTTSIGLAASGTGIIPAFTTINNGTAPVTATIIVTATFTNAGVNCTGAPDTFFIIVNPTARINAISDKVECNGSAVAAIIPTSTATGGTVTYTWTNNNTAIGLGAGGTGNVPAFTATNTGTTAVTATIIVTPTFTANGVICTGINDTFTLTVNPPPVFAATADKTVCIGTTTPVSFTTPLTGGTAVFSWANSNTAIGLAAGGTGAVPAFTAANTTTAPVFGEIVVSMAYTNAGLTCVSLNDTFDYIVNPVAVVNAVSNQVVCNNAATTNVNFTSPNTGGITTYSWSNSNTGIGLAASGNGPIASFTATNNGDTVAVATITVTPSFTNNGVSCSGASKNFTLTVNPTAQVNAIASQVVCNNTNIAAVTFSTTRTGGITTYSWTNSNTAIGLAGSGTGNIAGFTATNNTTAPLTATITVTPSFTNGGVSCTGPVKTFTITVNPTVGVNTVNNQVACNGASTAEVTFSSNATGGSVFYDWTNNNTIIGLAAAGSGDIAAFMATNTTNSPIVATITVTPTFIHGGVNCVGTPSQFTITVNPTATLNPLPDRVACNGTALAAITPAGNTTGGTVSYSWTNSNTAIGLPASGTGNIPAFTATNTGVAAITAIITVTPIFTNGGVSCTGTADNFTLTVNPTVTVNTVGNQVVCNGSATTAINFSNSALDGSVTYTWTNNNTAIGLAASGNGSIGSFNAINNGNSPATATITVTPTYTNAGLSCIGTPATFTITVNPTVNVNAIDNKVACSGSTLAAINFSSAASGGTVTYSWTNSNTAIGLAAGGDGNIAPFNAVNNSNIPQIATITVTPLFSNGGASCAGTPATFTITVNPAVLVNTVPGQVLCNNSATAAVNFTSPASGGSIVYNWTNSNTAIGLAASGNGNIGSFTATNGSNAPITATVSVTATYTNAGISCSSAPQTFVYTVNPVATVNAIGNKTACNGSTVAAISFSSTTSGGTVTYNWTNSNTAIGLPANGSGNIASFIATNSGSTPVTATITVTPVFTNGSISCNGTPTTFTITVNPTAVVNAIGNQTVCAGLTNNSVSFSSPVAGATFAWTNSNPSIGLAAGGSGNVPSFVALNPSPNAISATITVTPTVAGCAGQPASYTVTVNGLSVAPVSINNPTPIVCADNAVTTLSVNGGVLGSGAIWKWYADSLNTVSIGSGATLSNIVVARTTTYFVRAEGACNNTAAASVVVQRANLVHHVRQHWNDVLLFDNSSRNYVAWQWYKNGAAVAGATLQQYSENNALAGTYYVVATDRNGVQSISCPLTITAGSFTGLRISLFPNPADNGSSITVTSSFSVSELVGATLTISDIYGRVANHYTQVSPVIHIPAPGVTGMYIVTLTLQNGLKYSTNLLTK